jgi:hypothetical protein
MQSVLRSTFLKYISWYLVVAMFVLGVTPRVFASLSPSEGVNLSLSDRAADLQKIQKTLEMKMIGNRLAEFGLTPDEIRTRMSQLNDQQVHQFALQLDQMKVAGDSGLGIVIGLLVIAILVVILVYLLGHRVVVK